jgi:prolipoprotein diacylglyceryltransferase
MISEFVKENQVVFEAAMKLNMGQWLSIPFIVMGIAGLYLSLKYKKRAILVTA